MTEAQPEYFKFDGIDLQKKDGTLTLNTNIKKVVDENSDDMKNIKKILCEPNDQSNSTMIDNVSQAMANIATNNLDNGVSNTSNESKNSGTDDGSNQIASQFSKPKVTQQPVTQISNMKTPLPKDDSLISVLNYKKLFNTKYNIVAGAYNNKLCIKYLLSNTPIENLKKHEFVFHHI